MKKKLLLTFLSTVGVLNLTLGQSWSSSGGFLTTTAAKVGIGTTTPLQKLTVQDGHLALTSSLYPSDMNAQMRIITAVTDRSRLVIGTNPDIATGAANGAMIQMCGKDNGWLPGRITYYSNSTIGGSHGNTISQEFVNINAASPGGVVGLMSLNDYAQKSVVTIGETPLPWTLDYGLMVDRGIFSRKSMGGSSYLNLFEVKDIGGKAVAIVGDVPLPPTPNAYGLLVERGVLTERVRVAVKSSAEWSDFVFSENYKLAPLKKVEAYIGTNGHLPDMPSAEDVVNNGLDLGQMQAKLLQKIEELTLYVIQQQKEIENLKNRR